MYVSASTWMTPAATSSAASASGDLLALRAGKSYEALLRERVLDPLGMKDTRITLTEGMRARLAQVGPQHGAAVLQRAAHDEARAHATRAHLVVHAREQLG